MDTESIFALLEERADEWIALRREFHRHPELMYDVDWTAAQVADQLERFGLEVHRNVGNHFGKGVVGILHGAFPGKTILLRSDMDALPIMERNETEYRSEVDGKMHACGHDAHMTMLLAAAFGLSQARDQLAGTIKFVFQPAEEGAVNSPIDGELRSGGRDLVESGVADDVSAAFAFHVWPDLSVGRMAVHRNRAMAASTHFRVSFQGISGHHGAPHLAADALMMAAQFVMDAKAAIASAVNPLEPAVLSFGSIQAGTVINAIAESGEVSGTYRAYEPETVLRIRAILERCAESSASLYGGTSTAWFRMGKALINTDSAVQMAVEAGTKVLGAEQIAVLDTPSLAGEDFAYFLDKAPGAMLLIGIRNEQRGITFPLHHPEFDLDESALLIGARLYIQLAVESLLVEEEWQ
ncbi:peptidase M20 [Paenibacillus baekrokdamisoli]|uniref:Peptidase M20 n=1 Tax=Paenibacillus baekrokdamisoli TaxID=1712516 RepID=A0A3G9IZI4_9BACL|nr:M20 family metallopeptidase [Paenibacillus baekrokdamisoli]MBB3071146.1 amidohydrolase [Paenibacillus baekrokdamisoli]BBH21565.1 peptidase M20 [Paenibacillus baekrokdamisoli]